MKFIGFKPPLFNDTFADFELSDGTIVDLYGETHLRGIGLQGPDLTFSFDSPEFQSIVLRFGVVRGLRVVQPPDWKPQEADQIEFLLVRPPGP